MFLVQPDALHAPSTAGTKVAIALQDSECVSCWALRGQRARDHLGVLSTSSQAHRYGSDSAFPASSSDHKLILWKHESKSPVNAGDAKKM